ncbi:unnamed protein product, partial [Porites lobata]
MSKINLVFVVFAVLAFVCITAGKNCETLNGTWYNQRGDELYLERKSDGRLVGEYRTEEQRQNRSAVAHSAALGTAPYDKPGVAFAFSVVWRNGTSATVWTAQCILCDGHEKLLTSWLQRYIVGTRKDIWESTRIGQDTFTRFEQSKSPKMNESTSISPPFVRRTIKIWDPEVKSKPCSLSGTWYNQLGYETILNQKNDGVVEGEYRTAVERRPGSAGKSFSKVLGIGRVGGPSSVFPFMVVWKGGSSVTGWLAQCFIQGENKTEIVETTWLLRIKVDACIDNWKSTMFGQDTFTHAEQRAGPRKK